MRLGVPVVDLVFEAVFVKDGVLVAVNEADFVFVIVPDRVCVLVRLVDAV